MRDHGELDHASGIMNRHRGDAVAERLNQGGILFFGRFAQLNPDALAFQFTQAQPLKMTPVFELFTGFAQMILFLDDRFPVVLAFVGQLVELAAAGQFPRRRRRTRTQDADQPVKPPQLRRRLLAIHGIGDSFGGHFHHAELAQCGERRVLVGGQRQQQHFFHCHDHAATSCILRLAILLRTTAAVLSSPMEI
ncbi:hypothetical protein SDC9_169275 [bioreactor metagenome]|uniref:Uncharacterized protein n=1 Tax=bioreactor metagenome TaxID=1076179 RepID=A0A645GDI6_9ZZZZ